MRPGAPGEDTVAEPDHGVPARTQDTARTDRADLDPAPVREADTALRPETDTRSLGNSAPPDDAISVPADRPAAGAKINYDDDNLTIDAHEDRWAWRRKIRRNPRSLAVYRGAVGIAGLLFIVLGLVTGPLPGPGGIPLVLLGLAIWSSEFEWAHRLMQWFKLQLHNFRQWSRLKQTVFWIVFFSCCGLFGWAYMMIFGIPGWVPQFADHLLRRIPGL